MSFVVQKLISQASKSTTGTASVTFYLLCQIFRSKSLIRQPKKRKLMMNSQQMVVILVFCLLVVANVHAHNFSAKKYGAKADGKTDASKAMMSAWEHACGAHRPSTVRILKGTYLSGPLKFNGPCKAPVTVRIQGTILAPVDLSAKDDWVTFSNINGLTVLGGIFDGQGKVAWSKNDCAKTGKCNNLPINLRFTSLTNALIQDITSKDSKLFHINILNCKNLTMQHITIDAPETSLNTDGIHIGRSSGIRIRDAKIRTGDDCVSLGDGNRQILVEGVTCGPGHGISIGSLGRYHDEQPVVGVTVRNCTITNTMNGVRIKTWPASPSGMVSDLNFENIVMNNVSTPILIDQEYCPYGKCQAKLPSRVKISGVSFKGISGTSATQVAARLVCSRGIPCQNVELRDINLKFNGKGQATFECANVQPMLFGKMFPQACTSRPKSLVSP